MIPAKFLILQPDPSHSKLTSGLIAPGPLQCNFPSASIVGSGCRLVPAQPWPIWEKPAAGAGKNSTRFPFPSAPSLSNEFRGAPSCQISPNLGSWNSLHVQIQAVTQCPNPPRPGSDWYQHHPPLHLRRPPHVHVSVSAEAPSSGMMRIGHALGSTRDTWKCSIDDNWWLEIPQDHEWLKMDGNSHHSNHPWFFRLDRNLPLALPRLPPPFPRFSGVLLLTPLAARPMDQHKRINEKMPPGRKWKKVVQLNHRGRSPPIFGYPCWSDGSNPPPSRRSSWRIMSVVWWRSIVPVISRRRWVTSIWAHDPDIGNVFQLVPTISKGMIFEIPNFIQFHRTLFDQPLPGSPTGLGQQDWKWCALLKSCSWPMQQGAWAWWWISWWWIVWWRLSIAIARWWRIVPTPISTTPIGTWAWAWGWLVMPRIRIIGIIGRWARWARWAPFIGVPVVIPLRPALIGIIAVAMTGGRRTSVGVPEIRSLFTPGVSVGILAVTKFRHGARGGDVEKLWWV